MKKFRKKLSENKEIPTASLPDIIFMLLFFFMVVTVMRPEEIMVVQKIPKATQLKKIEKKSLVAHLYIGTPKEESQFGSSPRIQFNDVFISTEQVPQKISTVRTPLSEVEKDQLIVSLKIDEEVKMGIVNDVEERLKEAKAFKVMYNTLKDSNPSGK